MTKHTKTMAMFNISSIKDAIIGAIGKLTPKQQWKNPVMFVVYLGSLLTTVLWLNSLNNASDEPSSFILAISLWLWFTVLFANFAEAMAEGRSKAQAAFLRSAKRDIIAKKLDDPRYGGNYSKVTGSSLRKEDVVLVEAGDFIPGDGDVIEGVATVDESAITGESAPVIRESGGDFSSVTGGTRVLSDWLVVRISANPGETFLDKMIAMVESASRQKTPNEIALTILLVALTLVFLMATVTLLPFSLYSVQSAGAGQPISITVLVALLVCLIPTTIGGLLSAIGVAGIGRMMQKNVIATSGRAVEAAGDVDVLLLDKTGTITLGNRQASAFIPVQGVSEQQLADAAQLASLADETPEGRSIVVLAKQKFGIRERDVQSLGATFIHFSAQTRMSGVNLPSPSGKDDVGLSNEKPSPKGEGWVRGNKNEEKSPILSPHPNLLPDGEGVYSLKATVLGSEAVRQIRKGAEDAIRSYVIEQGGSFPDDIKKTVIDVARRGSTPLVVAEGKRALGVIELKDIVKGGIKERFIELRQMGIKTIMITGDNRLTAAAIAAEAGVDDFLAEATPEAKLKLIRQHQSDGRLVAMTGDGTNDAPALAQADVAVAMNSGTQAAKEAGNMVDLDSNPTKLIEIVETGKQMLMTRGALTTFSIANDVAKYFAIIPAAFATTYPALNVLNVMHLATPSSAILSAVIFNALIIIALIPLALKGIRYRPVGAANLLQNNLLIYGVGGLIVPFIGIKVIDVLLVSLSLV